MQHAESASAIRPDQKQRVLPLGYRGQRLLDFGYVLDGVAIDLNDHVSALQAGIVGGAAGLYLLHYRAMNLGGQLELLT